MGSDDQQLEEAMLAVQFAMVNLIGLMAAHKLDFC
jgi:hypothetical protein